ncbi:cupin domain-containing protein [Streptomyces tendae]
MTGDQLSEVLDVVEIRGLMSGGFTARGPWVAGSTLADPLRFIAMARGRARLTADGVDDPLDLKAGDIAILNSRSWLELQGGTGDGAPRKIEVPVGHSSFRDAAADLVDADDIVLGGHIDSTRQERPCSWRHFHQSDTSVRRPPQHPACAAASTGSSTRWPANAAEAGHGACRWRTGCCWSRRTGAPI